jgi:hypothetical protein
VLDHDRRKIIHFGVTENPTQVWLSHQITETFPRETAPRHQLRDRDASYGPVFRTRVRGMGVEEIVIAPRSPWQTPFVERLIGSIRRECLDHVIVFNECHLRRVLSSYFQYHPEARTRRTRIVPSHARRNVPLQTRVSLFPQVRRVTPPPPTSRRLKFRCRLTDVQTPAFGAPDRSSFSNCRAQLFPRFPFISQRKYRSRRKSGLTSASICRWWAPTDF